MAQRSAPCHVPKHRVHTMDTMDRTMSRRLQLGGNADERLGAINNVADNGRRIIPHSQVSDQLLGNEGSDWNQQPACGLRVEKKYAEFVGNTFVELHVTLREFAIGLQ